MEKIEATINEDIEKASEEARKRIKEDPTNSANYYFYGMVLFKKEMYSEAAMLFEIANLLEENVEYLFMAFLSYLMEEKTEQARYAINQAMMTDKAKTLKLLNDFVSSAYESDKSLSEDEKHLIRVKVKLFAQNFE